MSDGDFNPARSGSEALAFAPKTIRADTLVDEALGLFEEHRITTLFVVEPGPGGMVPLGVLHIHDCSVAR